MTSYIISTCYATWSVLHKWLSWVGSFNNSAAFPVLLPSISRLSFTLLIDLSKPLSSCLMTLVPDHLWWRRCKETLILPLEDPSSSPLSSLRTVWFVRKVIFAKPWAKVCLFVLILKQATKGNFNNSFSKCLIFFLKQSQTHRNLASTI